MPNLLKQLELEELSLVDRPANAQAMVSLFKRDNSEEVEMTKKQMTEDQEKNLDKLPPALRDKIRENMDKGMSYDKAKKMAEEDMKKSEEVEAEAEIDKTDVLQAEIDTLKAENEKLTKALLDNGFVIAADSIEKAAEPEFIEYEGEQINKADIPAVILKALEEAEFAKADAELTKRATEALPHFAEEVAKSLVGEFGEVEGVMEALKAADKVFADNMKEVGKSDVDGNFATASDKLETLIKSYMDENKMTKGQYAKAYAAVAKTEEGKALINKTYKGE